jgi:hypothetical protein
MTMDLMMKRPMEITMKNHGLLICRAYDTGRYLPQCGKRERSQLAFKFIHLHKKKRLLEWVT